MKLAPAEYTQDTRNAILNRDRQERQDCNPDFDAHCIIFLKPHGVKVVFDYFNAPQERQYATSYDGRKWS